MEFAGLGKSPADAGETRAANPPPASRAQGNSLQRNKSLLLNASDGSLPRNYGMVKLGLRVVNPDHGDVDKVNELSGLEQAGNTESLMDSVPFNDSNESETLEAVEIETGSGNSSSTLRSPGSNSNSVSRGFSIASSWAQTFEMNKIHVWNSSQNTSLRTAGKASLASIDPPPHRTHPNCNFKFHSALSRLLGTPDASLHSVFLLAVAQSLLNVLLTASILGLHHSSFSFLAAFSLRPEAELSHQLDPEWIEITLTFRTLLSYHVVVLLAQPFAAYLFASSVRAGNTVELLAWFLLQASIFIYSLTSVFEDLEARRGTSSAFPRLAEPESGFPSQTLEAHRGLLLAQCALNAFFITLYLFTFWRTYKAVGWRRFRRVGGDRTVQRRVAWHHLHVVSLKLDGFMFAGYLIQWIMLVLSNPLTGLPSGAIAGFAALGVLLLLLGLVLAVSAARYQIPMLQLSFLLLLLCAMSYAIYELLLITTGPDRAVYAGARVGMTVFISAALVFGVTTMVTGFVNLVYMYRGPRLSFRELEGDEEGKSLTTPSDEDEEGTGFVERVGSGRSLWRIEREGGG